MFSMWYLWTYVFYDWSLGGGHQAGNALQDMCECEKEVAGVPKICLHSSKAAAIRIQQIEVHKNMVIIVPVRV